MTTNHPQQETIDKIISLINSCNFDVLIQRFSNDDYYYPTLGYQVIQMLQELDNDTYVTYNTEGGLLFVEFY